MATAVSSSLSERVWSALELDWIERFHDWHNAHLWMGEHYGVPIALCVTYLVVIFGIQHVMKSRERGFDLQRSLFLWYDAHL